MNKKLSFITRVYKSFYFVQQYLSHKCRVRGNNTVHTNAFIVYYCHAMLYGRRNNDVGGGEVLFLYKKKETTKYINKMNP